MASISTWSEKDTEQLKFLYIDDELTDVNELAEIFQKSRRSVISKLVQLKIYKKPEKEKKKSVKVLIQDLEKMLDIKIENMNLNKKENLVLLVQSVADKLEFNLSLP